MDEIDIRIIKELKQDSRKTFSSIAKKLGVKTQTIIGRYNKLREKGIIQACTISVDIGKLGYEGLATLLINSHKKSESTTTQEQLLNVDDVFLICKTIGDFDTLAVLVYRNTEDLFQKIQKIKRLPNTEEVSVSFTPNFEIPYPLPKSSIE